MSMMNEIVPNNLKSTIDMMVDVPHDWDEAYKASNTIGTERLIGVRRHGVAIAAFHAWQDLDGEWHVYRTDWPAAWSTEVGVRHV